MTFGFGFGPTGGGAPSNRSVPVSGVDTGRLLTLSRLFGSTSTFALGTGTDANLKLDNGDGIKAVAALGVGNSQDAWVEETATDGRMVRIKLTCVGAPVKPSLPAVTLTPGNGQISVSWVDGSNGGATITKHVIYVDGVKIAQPAGASPYVINGLTNGTSYSVQVAAVNSAGEGALSSAQSTKPIAVPIVTPGPAWTGANTAASSAPGSLAYYGAGTGFTSLPVEGTNARGSSTYQMNAGHSAGEYCEYIDDDNYVLLIHGAVGASLVSGRIDYVDFYLESDTYTRLSTIDWDPTIGAMGVRINLRAPSDRNGVARWYARVVPVNGVERLLSGHVWFNARPGQAGYIDRNARSVWVNQQSGANEYTTANRGSAAAPYRTLEYAMTCMLPSATAADPNSRTATKEGGYIYLSGGTHLVDGTNISDATPYTVRGSAPANTVLPVRVRAAPGVSSRPKLSRTVRQISSSVTKVSQGTRARFVASLDGAGNMTVTEFLHGSIHVGMRLGGGGMAAAVVYAYDSANNVYKVSYTGAAIPSQVISGYSGLQLKHNRLEFDGIDLDMSKFVDLGTNSTYQSLYFYNCNMIDESANILGERDSNGFPLLYRAQGSIGNSLVSLRSINRETLARNVTFKASCFTGWSKIIKCSGEYAWDAFFDDRDANSRTSMTVMNYRASKPLPWKSRLHDAEYVTVGGVQGPTGGITTIVLQVGPDILNTGDTSNADLGVMAVSGAQAGIIDTWASANTALPADNNAIGFAFSTTSGSTTLAVTGLPTAGKIQRGMVVEQATYFATETHVIKQLTTSEPDNSWGGRGTYQLSKAALATVTGGTGAVVSGGLYMLKVRGDLSSLAVGDRLRVYATGHGDAMQTNQDLTAVNIARGNWYVQGMMITGVDLQLILAQLGSINGSGTVTAAAGSTTATLSAAQTLYAGQTIRTSATSYAFVKTTATVAAGGTIELTAPFPAAVSGASFTIGKSINGCTIINSPIIKRVADTADNFGYAIGDYNDNVGQVQQGLRNFGYLCCTLIGRQKNGSSCYQFRPTQNGFGIEAFRMEGCIVDSVDSDAAFPVGFSADLMNYRAPASSIPIPGTSSNSTNDPTPVSEITGMLGAAYTGATITTAMALAAPFDILGNSRRVGDPLGAFARIGV